jgi:hypothetical protein
MNNPNLLPSEKIAIEFVLSDYPKKDDFDTIIDKVSEDHKDILIWEPFERMETSEVAGYIESLDLQIDDAINEAVEEATKDLLAALQKATDWLNELHVDQRPEFLEECYDAIAKATATSTENESS